MKFEYGLLERMRCWNVQPSIPLSTHQIYCISIESSAKYQYFSKLKKNCLPAFFFLPVSSQSVELCGDLGGNQHHIYHQMRSTQTSSKYFYLLPTKKPMKKHIIYHSRVNGITGLTSIDASVTSTNSLSRPLSCGSESIPNEFAFHGHH